MEQPDNSQRTSAKRDLILAFVLFIIVMTVGVVFYHHIENLGWIDAIYFTSATISTLGYGDFVPQTDFGKLFTAAYAFLGIGMFFGLAGVLFHNILAYSRPGRKRINKN